MPEESPNGARTAWPRLPPLREWEHTCATMHMWTQIVGKIRLSQAPWINHSWGAALHVTTRGLTSSPLPYGTRSFAIDLDFVTHALRIITDDGAERSFGLEPMPVAVFYRRLMEALKTLDIEIAIYPRPVEVAESIPFDQDRQHASYDGEAMKCYWQALLQAYRVLGEFRARFIGKVSPVHFFWGAFDLAVTRFSGRTAPRHPGGAPNCADWVMVEAYSHEVSSAGFWPGMGVGEASFYAYAYPEPEGFRSYEIAPGAASYLPALGEYLLPYEAVRAAADPDGMLLDFLQTTYEAAAELAHWDRAALERHGDIPPVARSARRREPGRAKR